MAIHAYIMTWALLLCPVLCVYQHFGGAWCFHLQGICQIICLHIPDNSSLSANHLFTVPSWYEVWGFCGGKNVIVVLLNCDLMEKRVLKFRVASIFGVQDGGGIFLWKVDNRLWNITLCDEDHSLNFPSFCYLHVALSISVYVCFRTWNENYVISIVRCVMPPCWVFF